MNILTAAALAALSLTACAPVSGSPSPGATALYSEGQTLKTLEIAVDAAAIGADVAVKSGALTRAQDLTIATVAGKVNAALVTLQTAYAAGDTPGVNNQLAALQSLLTSLNAAYGH